MRKNKPPDCYNPYSDAKLPVILVIFASTIIPCAWTGFACMENPCMHGICIDSLQSNSTHQCYCRNGFTGYSCQINWDECRSNPCLNGGSCVDGIASFNCSCPENFAGVLCEVDLSVCEEVFPCQNNGTCTLDNSNVTGSGFICSCPPGFTGHQCEIDISVCNSTENVCQNGGKCVDGLGTRFYCECEPGWSGETCHLDIDECSSQPCLNGGICVNKINEFSCACPFGFTGRACEKKLRICKENPCLNGAFCLNEDDDEDKKTCYCVPDYHGTLCEQRYDDCDPFPKCFNGGTCIDGVGEFACSCPPDFFGHTCQCTADNATEPECADYVNATAMSSPPTPSTVWVGLPSETIVLFSSLFGGYSETILGTITPTIYYPVPGSSVTTQLPEDLFSSPDLQISITKDIAPASPSIPSPSPYDPGGEGRTDLESSAILPFPDSSIPSALPGQDLSIPILPPTLSQKLPSINPPTTIYESQDLSASPTPPTGSEDTGTVIIYEPSSTARLDGSEESTSLEQLSTPGLWDITPTLLLSPSISSGFIVSPDVSSSPDESTMGFLPPASTFILPTIIDSDTLKVELESSPSIDMISTTVIPVPSGIPSAGLTAGFPPVTTRISDEVEQTEDLKSSDTMGLLPTPSLPYLPDSIESVTSLRDGLTTTVPPIMFPTPLISLQPYPSDSILLIESVDIITSSFLSDLQSLPPLLSQTHTIDAPYTKGPPVVTLTPVVGVTSNEALSPEPSSALVLTSRYPPLSTFSLVGDIDTISIASIATTSVLVIPTPTIEHPDSSSLPFPDATTTPPPSLPPTAQQPNLTDPCNNYCQNNARCIADSIEPICLCSFKYTGDQCEIPREKFRSASFTGDSFLSFRVPNDSAISKVDIRSKLVTIVPEGVLLYTGVGRMYALIFTQNGHVTLHFSCGSQSMHFVETRTRVDNGFNFTLDFRMEMIVQGVGQLRCSAEVSVNQSYIMKGEQIVGRDGAIVSAERPIETVFLGGVPPFHVDAGSNDDLVGILPGFRGCLHRLMVNQEPKDIYDDALDGKEVAECSSFGCVANPCHGAARCVTKHVFPFWECICPRGYKGHRCQIIVCSSNPCQNGATCTYSQESLELILASNNASTLEDGDAFTIDNGEQMESTTTTLSPSLKHQLQPICLCPLGFSGAMCQQRINVTKPAFRPHSGYSSYIAYDPIPRFIDWFQLKFHFVTKNITQISLLLYSGNDKGPQPLSMLLSHRNKNNNYHNHDAPSSITTTQSAHLRQVEGDHVMSTGFDQAMADAHPEPVSDFFAITFLQGFVALTWNLGSGTQRITTPSRIDNRLNIHTLFAGRSGRQAWLKVDGMRNVTGKTPGPLYRLNSDSNELYIGGYKSYKFEGLSHDLPLHQGFQGCIFDLGFRVRNRLYLPRPIQGRNVKNCFEEDC